MACGALSLLSCVEGCLRGGLHNQLDALLTLIVLCLHGSELLLTRLSERDLLLLLLHYGLRLDDHACTVAIRVYLI